MPINQRELAKRAGVSQTTVSLCLRSHPSIPKGTRERILRIARELGYKQNPLVASLMSEIRSNRHVSSQSCIALLVDAEDEKEWFCHELFRQQYEGMRARALALGFRTEVFYAGQKGTTLRAIDRILHTRGIRGLILAGSRRRAYDLSLIRWADYVCATISYTWDQPAVDRASAHHRHNVDIVFQKLSELGYCRIGVSLSPHARKASDRNWLSGALLWNELQPSKKRIPFFVAEQTEHNTEAFGRWIKKWKPDAIVTLDGWEKLWLHKLGLSTPDDIGLACVNRSTESRVSGVYEDHDLIGAACIDLVSAKLQHNDFGLPERPHLLLIEGRWGDGETLHHEKGCLSPTT